MSCVSFKKSAVIALLFNAALSGCTFFLFSSLLSVVVGLYDIGFDYYVLAQGLALQEFSDFCDRQVQIGQTGGNYHYGW